ncbi:hypothetical protein M2140_000072 [Clostridiales Family XIII bacterium PM5-7]
MKVRITDYGEVTIWCRSLEEAEEAYNCGQVETNKHVKFEEIIEEGEQR